MSIEVGRTHVVDVEAGATVPPEGHFLYARDTDKLFKSDGTTLTEIAGGGGGLDVEGAQDAVGTMVDTTLVYTDGTPLLSRAALTGDVTASAGSNSTTIANDAVSDAKLRNSAALSVIGRSANSTGDPADIAGATVGHVLQVATGPVLNFGNNKFSGPSGLKYHPDRTPSSGSYLEEFMDGAETLSWSWGNQGTASQSLSLDSSIITYPNNTTNHRFRWVTPPSGVDWTATSKTSVVWDPTSGTGYGNQTSWAMAVLETGSVATPTAISMLGYYLNSASPYGGWGRYALTSYTSAITGTNNSGSFDIQIGAPFYTQVRWRESTKVLLYCMSLDGCLWAELPTMTRTLAAGPIAVGYGGNGAHASRSLKQRVEFFRIRTDSAGTSGQYECGE